MAQRRSRGGEHQPLRPAQSQVTSALLGSAPQIPGSRSSPGLGASMRSDTRAVFTTRAPPSRGGSAKPRDSTGVRRATESAVNVGQERRTGCSPIGRTIRVQPHSQTHRPGRCRSRRGLRVRRRSRCRTGRDARRPRHRRAVLGAGRFDRHEHRRPRCERRSRVSPGHLRHRRSGRRAAPRTSTTRSSPSGPRTTSPPPTTRPRRAATAAGRPELGNRTLRRAPIGSSSALRLSPARWCSTLRAIPTPRSSSRSARR